MKKGIVVYGSYGYTGRLIVDECKRKNLEVLLSGRDEVKLKHQSDQSGYPHRKCDIDNRDELIDLLKDAVVVIHCAGPFVHTAKQMVEACLQTNTHYVDITGEIAVFEMLMKYDDQAKDAGIMVLPGGGFDVVPTDCLAMHLKSKLPNATHLQLAFKSGGGMSRGTINTIITSLGQGGLVRRNGELEPVALGARTLDVDFGSSNATTMCIPWGDVATAYRSTGIPNIEVYTAVSRTVLRWVRVSRWFNGLLRQRWIKSIAFRRMKNFKGPGKNRIERARAILWGKVWDETRSEEARLETASGYVLTARSSVQIADKILKGDIKTGYQTPATAYGEGLVFELEGTRKI